MTQQTSLLIHRYYSGTDVQTTEVIQALFYISEHKSTSQSRILIKKIKHASRSHTPPT